jgi:hypothetical protein
LSIGVIVVKANEWEGISVPRAQPDPAEEHRGLFDDLETQADLEAVP